ncbi:MAG: hypothetical protein GX594_04150 [Pirellulaceae bacterium]|nr:hypothetical protein [Pirellulaceae bacterium]
MRPIHTKPELFAMQGRVVENLAASQRKEVQTRLSARLPAGRAQHAIYTIGQSVLSRKTILSLPIESARKAACREKTT